jgi:hypothetical protein
MQSRQIRIRSLDPIGGGVTLAAMKANAGVAGVRTPLLTGTNFTASWRGRKGSSMTRSPDSGLLPLGHEPRTVALIQLRSFQEEKQHETQGLP